MARVVSTVVLLVAAVACREAPPATPVPRARPVTTAGIVANGVVSNGLYGDLALGALSAERIGADEVMVAGLIDPAYAKIIEYLVQCALPEGTSFEVGGHVFEGSTGLAPEWAEGPCELPCQEWVTACMLARNNAWGLRVFLDFESGNPAMAEVTNARETYSIQEGAFWGNYFVDPQRQYACRGDGREPMMMTARACARPGNRCGIQYVGPCGPTNGETGGPSERQACEHYDPVRGTYSGCRNRAFDPGEPVVPEGVFVTDRVFTTWVRPGPMVAGLDAPCEDDAVPEPEPAEVPGGAGARCDNDDDCDAALGLICETRFFMGYCTAVCEPTGDPTEEQSQCGGEGSTCLDWARGSPPTCTAPCAPQVRGGDCADGEICTNGWANAAQIDDEPGCIPFCSTDDDCPPETPCGRSGGCGNLPPPDALADGEPCRFVAEVGATTEGTPCRGLCYRVNTSIDQTVGICGSQINLAHGDDCPDDPSAMVTATGGDDRAVCLWRRCDVDADCTPPLHCHDSIRGMVCDYP